MDWNILLDRAYTPYSGHPEACVAEGQTGNYYAGVRVENISFPETISAIQSALFTCLSDKDKPDKLLLPHNYHGNDTLLKFWESEYDLDLIFTKDMPEIDLSKKVIPPDVDTCQKLEQLLDHAVVPNSQFPVSALLEVENGYISGVNIECSEWGLGLCAERLAIAKAISLGYNSFKALFVHTKYGEYSSPCGACRQVLNEQMPGKSVYLYHSNKTHSSHHISQLLPYSFQSNKLKKMSDH